MNPLPNRPLLNNSSMPLSLPNVPPFDPMAYNGRPRKVLPESSSLMNGMNLMSGPSSAPAAAAASGNPMQLLERSNPLGSAMLPQQIQQQQSQQQQQPQPQPSSQQSSQPISIQNPQPNTSAPTEEGKEDTEARQVTMIFRPDDAGEWKEKLRLSHEASEQARLAREGQGSNGAWNQRREYEDDVKDEETEVDDDESTVVAEGEDSKVWKPKRTLRKLVA